MDANSGFVDILEALPRSNVSELILKWCGMAAHESAALCIALEKGAALNVLNLRGNFLGAKEAGEIARALVKSGHKPVDLSLAGNVIGDDGARQLCESGALGAQSGCIRHLDLSGCAITGDGIRVLAPFLKDSCLQSLDLREMLLNDEDVSMLAQALALSNIRRVDISGTPLNQEGRRMLEALQHRNPELKLTY